MAAYADWAYYTETFKGDAIPQDGFDRAALRASEQIDRLTFGRAKTAEGDALTAVKNACCAAAEVIDQYGGGNVHSEKVGGHSITYAGSSMESYRRQLAAAIEDYLAMTGLMYRGLGC